MRGEGSGFAGALVDCGPMALAVAPDHLLPKSLPASIEAVLFDIDGTLVDSVAMVVAGLSDMYERFTGVRPPGSEVRSLMGMSLRDQIRNLPGGAPDTHTEAEMIAYAIERYAHHQALERPFDAATEALRLLQGAGVPVGLVTNKNDRELRDFLLRFPEASLVGAAVSADDVARPKPAPDPALLAAARLGVPPSLCAFVGDSRFDISSGREAGMFTVGVLYGSGTRAELASRGPDLLLETPEELRDALAGLLARRAAA